MRFRTEVPTHASWSQDGSLIAVSLGPYVALYDPNTMLVVKTLSCPECSTVLSTHFIGRSGRYIAIRGQRDLVLWDLICDSGALLFEYLNKWPLAHSFQLVSWHHHSFSLITHVFSHPRDEALVVFEAESRAIKTQVLKFTPTSPSPTSQHSLPFRLFSVAPCPPKWLQSNEPSSFAFVGITHSWNAVIFGDQIHLADTEPSDGKGLVGPMPVTKQTLFQDIFGKSAFADLTSRHNILSVPSSAAPWKGKQVEEIFRTPAYLMPPLGTLFDTLMDEFLQPRPAEADDEDSAERGQADEDVEMEEDGADAPIVVGNRLERIVDEQEMVSMIDLFKNHCLQRKLSVQS